MPLLEPLGSIYEGIARTWSERFVAAAVSQPTGHHILGAFVSTVDRCIPVTQALVNAMIAEAGVTVDQIRAVVQGRARQVNEPQTSTKAGEQELAIVLNPAKTRADVVQLLFWSMAHKGGKVRVGAYDVLDWLQDLFNRFGNHDQRLGGAPGPMLETLAMLCGERNAIIFTVFHSPDQASVYKAGIPFLAADPPYPSGILMKKVEARGYHQYRHDRLDDLDVKNYPLEYQPGLAINFGPAEDDTVNPQEPDRLICTAPYLHYSQDGKVDRPGPPIKRMFQFPGLNDQQNDACVQQIAQTYPYIILSGLQSASHASRNNIKRELEILCGKTTIHLEISGYHNLDWLVDLIPNCIGSVGINEDELPQVCDVLLNRGQPCARPYSSLWDAYLDARAVAVKLNVPRLYVHTHTADLILRRTPVADKDLLQEIRADLYAKWVVTRWLSRTMLPDSIPHIGPRREGLELLMTFMAQVVGLDGKTMYQWLEDTRAQVEAGYFTMGEDYAVIVVPVAWFLGPLAQRLITTGAGDRTSVVSFVQSGFSQPRLQRQP